ncbi:MAG: hypothetical protein EBX40_05255, partial [Gammaproteobacteria bacterium]|nr:hypothetical protein [Gammaproteobacteria bacterium]
DNFKQVGSLQIFLLTLGELGFPKSELEPANKLINQLLAGKRVSRSIEAVRVEYQQAEDHFSEKVRRLDALHTESEALVKKARDLNINESIVGELEKEQEKLLQHREQLWGVVSTLEDWSQLEHVDVLEFGLNQVYKLINLGDCKSATEYSKTYADTEPDSFAQLKQAIAEAEHAIERKAEARAQEKAAERAREVSAQAAEEASAREDRIRLEKMDESLSAELSSVFKLIDQEMKVHQKAPDKSKAQRISYQLEQLNTELQNAREEVQLKKDSNIVQIRATFRQTIATLLTKFIEALYSRFSHHKDFQESKLGQGLKELGYTASGETLDSSQFTATDVRPIRTQSALVVGNKENQDPHSKLGRAHTTHHFPRPGVFR